MRMQKLSKESFETKQHFTQPPAHYTEAALVKTLEELGIGRLQYLCADDHHDHFQKICGEGK